MKRTPLYDAHVALNARLVDFTGWEMPIQYSGVVDEYQAVRTAAGLFDVCHMGRISVQGGAALAFLQRVTTNDVARLGIGESHYSMLCNPQGGILDDVFLYRPSTQDYLVCANASNRDKIVSWLHTQHGGTDGLSVEDRSDELSQVALQGPASREILGAMRVKGLEGLKGRGCLTATVHGVEVLITRTGYTGELGYELYFPAGHALGLWEELLRVGKAHGLKPAGLGARDLLRLEMGYLLYGNDISEETTPLNAAMDWAVKFDKGEFIGREAMLAQQARGVTRRLVAFELREKAVPRHGCPVLSVDLPDGPPIGEVTSGNLSPILQKGIGLGYVPPAHTVVGTRLLIDLRGKAKEAVVVKPPFYRRAQRAGEGPSPTGLR